MRLESEDTQKAVEEAVVLTRQDKARPKISVSLKTEHAKVLRDAFCELSEEAWVVRPQSESFDERTGSTLISEFNRAINQSAGETANLQMDLEAMATISNLCTYLKQLATIEEN